MASGAELREVRMPAYPDCWETCGACYSGSVEVSEVLVAAGDRVAADQPVIVVELDKTTLDIPTTHGGLVAEIMVRAGDKVAEGQLILTVETGA